MRKEQICLEEGPETIGPYSPAIKVGQYLFLSAQLPFKEDGCLCTGDIAEQTKHVIYNIENLLSKANLSLEHVVKTTVYLKNIEDLATFNQIYAIYFSHPYPARTCIEVSDLPAEALLKIECIAAEVKPHIPKTHCRGNYCD